MSETTVELKKIEKLKITGQIVEIKLPGESGESAETIKKYITTVTFSYDGLPGSMDAVITALAADCEVNVIFLSPQYNLGDEFMRSGDAGNKRG